MKSWLWRPTEFGNLKEVALSRKIPGKEAELGKTWRSLEGLGEARRSQGGRQQRMKRPGGGCQISDHAYRSTWKRFGDPVGCWPWRKPAGSDGERRGETRELWWSLVNTVKICDTLLKSPAVTNPKFSEHDTLPFFLQFHRPFQFHRINWCHKHSCRNKHRSGTWIAMLCIFSVQNRITIHKGGEVVVFNCTDFKKLTFEYQFIQDIHYKISIWRDKSLRWYQASKKASFISISTVWEALLRWHGAHLWSFSPDYPYTNNTTPPPSNHKICVLSPICRAKTKTVV